MAVPMIRSTLKQVKEPNIKFLLPYYYSRSPHLRTVLTDVFKGWSFSEIQLKTKLEINFRFEMHFLNNTEGRYLVCWMSIRADDSFSNKTVSDYFYLWNKTLRQDLPAKSSHCSKEMEKQTKRKCILFNWKYDVFKAWREFI